MEFIRLLKSITLFDIKGWLMTWYVVVPIVIIDCVFLNIYVVLTFKLVLGSVGAYVHGIIAGWVFLVLLWSIGHIRYTYLISLGEQYMPEFIVYNRSNIEVNATDCFYDEFIISAEYIRANIREAKKHIDNGKFWKGIIANHRYIDDIMYEGDNSFTISFDINKLDSLIRFLQLSVHTINHINFNSNEYDQDECYFLRELLDYIFVYWNELITLDHSLADGIESLMRSIIIECDGSDDLTHRLENGDLNVSQYFSVKREILSIKAREMDKCKI